MGVWTTITMPVSGNFSGASGPILAERFGTDEVARGGNGSINSALIAGVRRPRRRRTWSGALYALPAVGLVAVFLAYPVASTFYYSFTRWAGYGPTKWIGFTNFINLFHDPFFLTAIRNNGIFALTVPVILILSLLLAYLIHERIPGWRFFRWVFFLPAVYATVVIGIITGNVLQSNGPIVGLFHGLHIDSLATPWLLKTNTSLLTIGLVIIFSNFGYSMIIFLSGMASVDPGLAEAARLDGAGFWRILRQIYVPNLRRVLELVLVLNTITAFAYTFTYVYVITNGGPGNSTYTTDFYMYESGFTNAALGYAAAMAVILILVIAIIGSIQIRVVTKGQV